MCFYAFGSPVPASVVDEVIKDGTPLNELSNEWFETFLYYDYQDEL